MMFEVIALGVIVFLGVTFEVLFSIRTKILSILNATAIHPADSTGLRRTAFTPSEMAG